MLSPLTIFAARSILDKIVRKKIKQGAYSDGTINDHRGKKPFCETVLPILKIEINKEAFFKRAVPQYRITESGIKRRENKKHPKQQDQHTPVANDKRIGLYIFQF